MVMIASTFSFGLAALMLVWLIAALQGRKTRWY
jgi:iron complex transport system permease protein